MVSDRLKVLYLSSFPPRECGIATFTQDYLKAIQQTDLTIDQEVVAINEKEESLRSYPAYVKYKLQAEDPGAYDRAASYINNNGANLFCLQHEFGLFGGLDGIFILKLLEKIKIPIITFLHTIPVLRGSKRRKYRLSILKKICKFSKYIIVTADIGKKTLIDDCHALENRFVTIRHGGPDISFPRTRERKKLREQFNLAKKFVILSYGLLSKNKGYRLGIEAVSKLTKKYPNIVYLILGRQHPLRIKKEGDIIKYFRKKARALKVKKNILFIAKYIDKKELITYLKIPDVYLMPYLTKEQISSGTLAYAITTGNCIVTTPFAYAKELLVKKRGYFIDFESSSSIVKVVSDLIENPKKIEETRRKAYKFARKFIWAEVAKKTIQVFRKAIKK